MGKRSSFKKQRQDDQNKAARLRLIRYGGLALIIMIALAAVISWRSGATAPPADMVIQPHIKGVADAPVQIVEYGDLTCSACRQWHNLGFKEQLFAEFGDQLSFEFRHFPVITPSSPKGAEAAQCAAEQEGFWLFHDYIYENLPPYPNLNREQTLAVAAAVGLDQTAFDACLDVGRYRAFPAQAAQEARRAGATGTPTFFINGRPVSASYMAMSAMINAILEN